MSILFIRVIGGQKTNESEIKLHRLLDYKNSYTGDNSAIGNIIANLPASSYHNGFELQTTIEPYEITINYTLLETVDTYLEDGTIIPDPLSEVLLKNALIVFAPIKNVDLIHFELDPGYFVTYNRKDLVTAYEATHDKHIEQIITSTSTIKSFIETDFYYSSKPSVHAEGFIFLLF